jgi:hypothetical protein
LYALIVLHALEKRGKKRACIGGERVMNEISLIIPNNLKRGGYLIILNRWREYTLK